MMIFAVIGALAIGLVFAFVVRWVAQRSALWSLRIFPITKTNKIKNKYNNTGNKSYCGNYVATSFIRLKRHFNTVRKLLTKKHDNDISTQNCGTTHKSTLNDSPNMGVQELPHTRIIDRLLTKCKRKRVPNKQRKVAKTTRVNRFCQKLGRDEKSSSFLNPPRLLL
jgi:hypothetical protein